MKRKIVDPDLAERIKVLVERAGNVERLARKAGIASPTVVRLLTGTVDPSRETLVALARAVGVRVNWIATGEAPMEEEGGAGATESAREDALGGGRTEEIGKKPPGGGAEEGRTEFPYFIQAVIDAVVEVMQSNHAGIKLALTQNILMFQEILRDAKKIRWLEDRVRELEREVGMLQTGGGMTGTPEGGES